MGIFTCYFSDRANVPFPYQRTLFEPIMFGLVLLDKTSKVMRASAHLKPVTQEKLFSSFNIILMHNQNTFRGFRAIPMTQAESFYQIET